MPCHYEIFPAENLVAKTYCGRVTAKCVLRLLDDIECDRNYQEGMAEFDDLSQVADLAITATEIGHFADLVSGLSKRKRRPTRKAIFAPHGPGRAAAYGFSKMVEGVKGFEVGVFDDVSAAMTFLGIASDRAFDRTLVSGLKVH